MSKLRNKGLMICEVKPKAKALRHIKVEVLRKLRKKNETRNSQVIFVKKPGKKISV